MTIQHTDPISLSENLCSCAAGKGFCQHQVAHYKTLGMASIPEVVSSTSAPQKWQVPPRTHGISTRPLTEVKVIKPSLDEPAKKQRAIDGICSILYNPINTPLHQTGIQQQLLPVLKDQETPSQWLQLWTDDEDLPLAKSNFGSVPHGSLLSYHEKPKKQKVHCLYKISHIYCKISK